MPTATNALKFPSGRNVKRAKQDARALAKRNNIPLYQALDTIAEINGCASNWSKALLSLQRDLPLPDQLNRALSWLALLDTGDYEDGWLAASDFFQYRNSPEKWINKTSADRRKFGHIISRKPVKVISVSSAITDEWLEFHSEFNSGVQIVERMMLSKDTGSKVDEYSYHKVAD